MKIEVSGKNSNLGKLVCTNHHELESFPKLSDEIGGI